MGTHWAKNLFTAQEDELLNANYATCTFQELQTLLPGRSLPSIKQRARRLGLNTKRASQVAHHTSDYSAEVQTIFLPDENEKRCSGCKQIKPLTAFYRNRANADGYHNSCKVCDRERHNAKIGKPVQYEIVEDDILPGHKRCISCKQVKKFDEFYRRKTTKDGLFRECKTCSNARDKSDRHIYQKYGITQEEYNAMFAAQNGVCACCGQPETATHDNGRTRGPMPLSVDHSHTTGAVRGLLCSNCNTALGLLKEDPERVRALLKYIEDRCLW